MQWLQDYIQSNHIQNTHTTPFITTDPINLSNEYITHHNPSKINNTKHIPFILVASSQCHTYNNCITAPKSHCHHSSSYKIKTFQIHASISIRKYNHQSRIPKSTNLQSPSRNSYFSIMPTYKTTTQFTSFIPTGHNTQHDKHAPSQINQIQTHKQPVRTKVPFSLTPLQVPNYRN